MSKPIVISIVLLKFGFILSSYLEAEPNYQKPNLERNNIINKGVWVRNKFKENLFEKSSLGNFIFRTNSIDIDNLLQNNFDAFGENYMQDTPFVSNYVERARRSPSHIRKRRPRKSMKKCNNKIDCNKSLENSIEDATIIKSKIISDLKPASLFNDYPYEVAILLNNNKIHHDTKDESFTKDKTEETVNKTSTVSTNNTINVLKDNTPESSVKKETNRFKNSIASIRITKNNVTIPKRSMKYDYESEINNRIALSKDFNKTYEKPDKYGQSVFNTEDRIWKQNGVADNNIYNVIPKIEPGKPKAVTERGLIKVTTMLTKTFKKIMRQHDDIRIIHDKLQSMDEEFIKNITLIKSKFEDFNLKYSHLLRLNDQLRLLEAKLDTREEYFKNKERVMENSFIEFESQQKKFLAQQRQFFNIQKSMLAQNEKINTNQNLIAKTQSEISHRQNNFARILKKAKQLYIDSKHPVTNKVANIIKLTNKDKDLEFHQTTTSAPTSTESVKINLFSIPVPVRLKNQDDLIMKDKDDQPIDDLVYKYYFNNTFIDNLMKSKVLNSISNTNNIETRNVKNKRSDFETTVLLPVKSKLEEPEPQSNRPKRWIHPHTKHTERRKSHTPDNSKIIITKTGVPSKLNNTMLNAAITKNKKIENNKANPFLEMATNFCNAIRQNTNKQVLFWCVEKALRRLQYIDLNFYSPAAMKQSNIHPNAAQPKYSTNILSITTVPTNKLVTSSNIATSPTDKITPAYAVATVGVQQENIFFPDNEELEVNLKQYELKPDMEGNVYYDGSLHVSDIVKTDSNGFSDIMPGLDSNSKIDMDPIAFDLHSRRRAHVQRMNDDIIRHIKLG